MTPKDGDNFLNKWTKTPGNGGAQSSEVSHEDLLNESVSADTTYTAQLEAESYTIEAKYGETTYTETVTHGNKISENFPTDETAQDAAPEGYEFTGCSSALGENYSRGKRLWQRGHRLRDLHRAVCSQERDHRHTGPQRW